MTIPFQTPEEKLEMLHPGETAEQRQERMLCSAIGHAASSPTTLRALERIRNDPNYKPSIKVRKIIDEGLQGLSDEV